MDPREYSFVRNGPDCVCHHSRADHVGWYARYEMMAWDLRCQVPGCESCPAHGYWPLGPLNYMVLQAHDEIDRAAAHAAERAWLKRLRIVSLALLFGSIPLSILAGFANRIWGLTVLAVVLVIVALGMVAGYAVITVKVVMAMDPPRGLMLGAVLLPLPVMALTAIGSLIDVPPAWYLWSCVALVGTALAVFGVEHRRAMKRHRRSVRRIRDDVEWMQGWEPILAIEVRFNEPDANEEPDGPAPRPSQ